MSLLRLSSSGDSSAREAGCSIPCRPPCHAVGEYVAQSLPVRLAGRCVLFVAGVPDDMLAWCLVCTVSCGACGVGRPVVPPASHYTHAEIALMARAFRAARGTHPRVLGCPHRVLCGCVYRVWVSRRERMLPRTYGRRSSRRRRPPRKASRPRVQRRVQLPRALPVRWRACLAVVGSRADVLSRVGR